MHAGQIVNGIGHGRFIYPKSRRAALRKRTTPKICSFTQNKTRQISDVSTAIHIPVCSQFQKGPASNRERIDNKNRKGTLSLALIERDRRCRQTAPKISRQSPTGLKSQPTKLSRLAAVTVKALIVANEFLESEVCELMQAVSHAYTE